MQTVFVLVVFLYLCILKLGYICLLRVEDIKVLRVDMVSVTDFVGPCQKNK